MNTEIHHPSTRFWRWTITLVVILISWWIRSMLMPTMTVKNHLYASVVLLLVIQLVWYMLFLIHKLLNRWMPWKRNRVSRIVLQLGVGIIAVIYFRDLVFLIIDDFSEVPKRYSPSALVVFANAIISISINIVFLSDDLIKGWKTTLEQTGRLQKERMFIQLEHLKKQVDPDSILHQFTATGTLVNDDPLLASQFVGHMARVYRYVLQQGGNILVKLEQEVKFVKQYIALLEEKYDKPVDIEFDISHDAMNKGILMIGLQMLVDHALVHNPLANPQPLFIEISNVDDVLIFKSNKLKGIESEFSGLKQLSDLYSMLGNRNISIQEEDQTLIVSLPLLPYHPVAN